jgi:hypothetical protein
MVDSEFFFSGTGANDLGMNHDDSMTISEIDAVISQIMASKMQEVDMNGSFGDIGNRSDILWIKSVIEYSAICMSVQFHTDERLFTGARCELIPIIISVLQSQCLHGLLVQGMCEINV